MGTKRHIRQPATGGPQRARQFLPPGAVRLQGGLPGTRGRHDLQHPSQVRHSRRTYIKIHPFEGLDDTSGEVRRCCVLGLPERPASPSARRCMSKLLDVSSKVIDLEIAPAQGARRHRCPRSAPCRPNRREVKMSTSLTRIPAVVEQIEPMRSCVLEDCRETCRTLGNFHGIASGLWESRKPLDPDLCRSRGES